MRESHVVVRMARDMPTNYLTGWRDGMIVDVHDLDVLPDHPLRPAIALPTEQIVEWGGRRLPVYEIHALGSTRT